MDVEPGFGLVAWIDGTFSPGHGRLAVPAIDVVARRLPAMSCAEIRVTGPFPDGAAEGFEALGYWRIGPVSLTYLVMNPEALACRDVPAPTMP